MVTQLVHSSPELLLLLLLQGKEVLPGLDDPTADPSRQFYSNYVSLVK
jgi:hypothetical protein